MSSEFSRLNLQFNHVKVAFGMREKIFSYAMKTRLSSFETETNAALGFVLISREKCGKLAVQQKFEPRVMTSRCKHEEMIYFRAEIRGSFERTFDVYEF